MQAKAAQLHIDQSHLQAGCLTHTLFVLLLSASTSSPAENWQTGEQDWHYYHLADCNWLLVIEERHVKAEYAM
jgi:hypothetical protein